MYRYIYDMNEFYEASGYAQGAKGQRMTKNVTSALPPSASRISYSIIIHSYSHY
jgi:hypothetical protein